MEHLKTPICRVEAALLQDEMTTKELRRLVVLGMAR